VIDVFITFSLTWLMLVFMCSHRMLPPAVPKTREKRAKAGFRLFWDNINRQMMDYH
jgi:hypothetical protein